MASLAEAAVALGLGETWDLSVLKDDGTFVVPNSGPGGAAGGLAPFTRTINPAAPLPANPVLQEEVDPVAAKATADAYNARYGEGMTFPWRRDPNSPPRPGVPAQRAITQDAKGGWWNLDERRPSGVQVGGVFHVGDFGGVLDKVLPNGYPYSLTDEQDCARLDKLAMLMGHSGGIIDGSTVQAALPRVDFLRAEVNGAVAPGETLETWTARNSQPPPVGTGKYLSPYYDNLGVLRQVPLPVPPPLATTPTSQPPPTQPTQQATTGGSTAQPPATSDPHTLLLLGRFKVQATWTANGSSGPGTVGAKLPADPGSESGYFWFFSSGNVEVVVSLLDGRQSDGHYWVKLFGGTNVGVEITVTDTQTGKVKTYSNPAGTVFRTVLDTAAF